MRHLPSCSRREGQDARGPGQHLTPPRLLSSPAPGTPGTHFPKTRGCAGLWARWGPVSLLRESHRSAPVVVSCRSLPSWTPGAVQECTSRELPCATGCSASEPSAALEQDLRPFPCSQTKPCPRAVLGCLGTLVPPLACTSGGQRRRGALACWGAVPYLSAVPLQYKERSQRKDKKKQS